MAKLYFRYSTVNAGKSMDLLKVAHNYMEQNKKALILTSGLDDRTQIGEVSSRVGIKQSALPIFPGDSVLKQVESFLPVSCILVDESQFLEPRQIKELATLVDSFNIPVIAYGLKNDFQGNLFEGTKELLVQADRIEEIKTTCWYCTKKATQNLRLINDVPTYQGEQIQIGGNEAYRPTCRFHYHHPEIGLGS